MQFRAQFDHPSFTGNVMPKTDMVYLRGRGGADQDASKGEGFKSPYPPISILLCNESPWICTSIFTCCTSEVRFEEERMGFGVCHHHVIHSFLLLPCPVSPLSRTVLLSCPHHFITRSGGCWVIWQWLGNFYVSAPQMAEDGILC